MNRVSVIGLGKLGLPMAAAIGEAGFTVIGVDNNPEIVQALNDGDVPIQEKNLGEYLALAQRLTFTTNTVKAIVETDITFIIVPTPSLEDGAFSNEYVFSALTDVGKAIARKDSYHLVVVTSTVMPGTMWQAQRILEQISDKKVGNDFGLCYSPEFIALGSVIADFLDPDFVLIGESDCIAGDKLGDFYQSLCFRRADTQIARMGYGNAELAKIALNCFVVTKITYANFLAQLCEHLTSGNVDDVTQAVGLDSRIGRKYLTGGAPYGGPCFPRDSRAMSALAKRLGVSCVLPTIVEESNHQEVLRLYDLVIANASPDAVIAVLGLAYKAGTHITEESAGLKLVELLESAGCTVVVHDPMIPDTDSAQNCIDTAQVVVLALPHQAFVELEYKDGQVVIDCWRILKPFMPVGIKYIGIGLGEGQ